MGTKNNPSAIDAYTKAEPDEPLFVLLGRDRHAPTLVWLWATLRELDGEDPVVVKEARESCLAMLLYASEHGRPAVGLGAATVAGLCDLIRTVNAHAKEDAKKNNATDDDAIRRFLAYTEFYFSEAEKKAGDQ